MDEKLVKGCFEIWLQELRVIIENRRGLNLSTEILDCNALLSIDKEVWQTSWEDGDTPAEALDNELAEWDR